MNLITRSDDERLAQQETWSIYESAERIDLLKDSLLAALSRAEKAEAALCRAMDLLRVAARTDWRSGNDNDYTHAKVKFLDDFMSMESAPCPHEAEAKRLREAGPGAMAAIEERIRQKSVEEWTPDHDAQHSQGELSIVAACYALNKMPTYADQWWDEVREWWPWHPDWDKREKHSREHSLAIAAALCMAELDRLAELRRRVGG